MPKLSNKELAKVKYVSMADYFNKVDQFEDFNDKLKFTTRYLLTHSGVQNPDYSIEQAIHLAKVKLTDASIKKHDEYKAKNKGKDTEPHIVDPYSKDDKAAEMFMANPVDYLVGEANKTIKELNDLNIKLPEHTKLETECLNTLDSMSLNVRDKIKQLDKGSRVLDVKARMEAKFGGKESLDKAYAATKGGFMSRLFGTSSTAAKNLDQVYKAFNNPNHVLYGNTDALDKAAVQYIQHNFPDWETFQKLPTEADMVNLSDTEKARTTFSINILKSLSEQNDMEEKFGPLVKACENKNIEYSEIKEDRSTKIIDLSDPDDEIEDDDEIEEQNQAEFRAKLFEDTKENEEMEYNEAEENDSLENEIDETQIDELNNSK